MAKLSEITQIIRDGDWCCDYTLESAIRKIDDWISDKDYKLQILPDFQRGRIWTDEQQIKYIEAVLQGGAKNAKIIYLNCPFWSGRTIEGYCDFVIVDGLQRYTAIKRFINNEIPAFGTLYKNWEGSFRTVQGIKINVNSLKTRREVLTWYLEINEGGTPHTKSEIDRVKDLLKGEIKND